MFSAKLGMVVSRACWFLLLWLLLDLFPFHVIVSLRGLGISWGTRLGIVVEALGGFILMRGSCRYRRHWQVGG